MTRRRGESPQGQRQLRMGELLRHALAVLLARGELRDPALRDAPITVTEVRVAPDLRRATVFVTPLGGANMETVVAALQRARGYFRGQIAHMIEAKFVPDLRFQADESFEAAQRVESLLRVAAQRDRRADEEDDDGAL